MHTNKRHDSAFCSLGVKVKVFQSTFSTTKKGLDTAQMLDLLAFSPVYLLSYSGYAESTGQKSGRSHLCALLYRLNGQVHLKFGVVNPLLIILCC